MTRYITRLMLLKLILLNLLAMPAFASADQAFLEQLVAQGVNPRIERLLEFRERSMGAEFVQDVYYCKGKETNDSSFCGNKERITTSRTVKVEGHEYMLYVDMKQPSFQRRLYFIHIPTGKVESFLVAHGKGTGDGFSAIKFSNRKDSKQTSLGIYIVGPTYKSPNHGLSLRLYGLERSNDRAYLRDIVLHGARYAEPSFLEKVNPKTGKTMERLGESWGCPAIDRSVADRLVPLLANGALLYIDHADLMDEALSGNPVAILKTIPLPKARPSDAPQAPQLAERALNTP